MKTRSPSQFLIDKFKEAGHSVIYPNGCVRFVKPLLSHMPDDWQNLNREQLIKKIREHCEVSAATGKLKRKRDKEVSGYVYHITS